MPLLPQERLDHIRSEAAALLTRYHDADVTFALLQTICRSEGVDLLDADLRDIAGALRPEGGRWRVYLNRADAPARRRFTLAHALGHYFLHADGGRAFVEGGFSRPRAGGAEDGVAEREADEFAACLVMPGRVIAAILAGRPPTARRVLDLAARFGVSPLAVACRLQVLGYAIPAPGTDRPDE